MRTAEWHAKHQWRVTADEETQLLRLIEAVAALDSFRPKDMAQLLRRYPRARGQFSKDQLVLAYRQFCDQGRWSFDPELLRRLQMTAQQKPLSDLYVAGQMSIDGAGTAEGLMFDNWDDPFLAALHSYCGC